MVVLLDQMGLGRVDPETLFAVVILYTYFMRSVVLKSYIVTLII